MRGPWSQFVNQHSYLLVAVGLLVVVAAISLLFGRRIRIALIGAALFILAVVFAFLRVGPGDIRSPAELEGALRAGRPVTVEFYSDYCIACLGAKPDFDELEREFAGRAAFLRANLQSEAGQALAERYEVDTVPTFLAFDRDGLLVLQLEGDPGVPLVELRRTLASPSTSRGP
jgi:thiol-disulfide isomerase/thioredoxin